MTALAIYTPDQKPDFTDSCVEFGDLQQNHALDQIIDVAIVLCTEVGQRAMFQPN